MRRALSALLLATCLAPPPAVAATADRAALERAVQCFVVSLATIDEKDVESSNPIAYLPTTFYAGQIFALDPEIDLSAAMDKQSDVLTDNTVAKLVPSCEGEFARRSAQIRGEDPAPVKRP